MKSENVRWKERKDEGLHMDSAIEIPSLQCLLSIYLCIFGYNLHLHICLMGSSAKVYSSPVFIYVFAGSVG